MKNLIIVFFALVVFTSCATEEPVPVSNSGNSMFGVSGEREEFDDLYEFTVQNSNKSEYLKFKDDAESYFNIKMDDIETGVGYTSHYYYDGYSYYSIFWYDNNDSFVFGWSK